MCFIIKTFHLHRSRALGKELISCKHAALLPGKGATWISGPGKESLAPCHSHLPVCVTVRSIVIIRHCYAVCRKYAENLSSKIEAFCAACNID